VFVRRRPLLRAAALGGGAYVAGRSMERAAQERQYHEAEQNERLVGLEQQAAHQQAPLPPAAPTAAAPSMLDQLSRLSALHEQGALTDDEFTAAKAKLLGS
jgi:hypothetical protein